MGTLALDAVGVVVIGCLIGSAVTGYFKVGAVVGVVTWIQVRDKHEPWISRYAVGTIAGAALVWPIIVGTAVGEYSRRFL